MKINFCMYVATCIIILYSCNNYLQVKIGENLSDVVKYEVDRSTHDDKLRDFHEWMKAVKKDSSL